MQPSAPQASSSVPAEALAVPSPTGTSLLDQVDDGNVTDVASDPGTTAFGGTFTWDDGLSITVSQPKKFKPSEYAAADKAPAYVAFAIKITNGTGEAFDPVLVSTTVQSGGEESSSVFDSAKKLSGSPSTKVLPGKSVSYLVGFGVQDPQDIVMEITPDFDHESAIFTS